MGYQLSIRANMKNKFSEIDGDIRDGDIRFGTMTVQEAKQYRGSIVMNTEEELFYSSLTVGKTMDFATRLNIPDTLPRNAESREDYRSKFKNFLLDSMGITHTEDTKVGDAFIRGVSGGERKRVSIIETLCTRGSVMCWDNSTRGLDASTALEFTRALRSMTDTMGIATVVTLYQAGNGIYELFDKVLVLDEGKQVYYGPLEQARPFMESLGFLCRDGANVADFLTGVTVPSERKIWPGFESRFPAFLVTILSLKRLTTNRPSRRTWTASSITPTHKKPRSTLKLSYMRFPLTGPSNCPRSHP